jgi:hypothetical protein
MIGLAPMGCTIGAGANAFTMGAGASLNLNGSASTSATIYATFDRMMINTTDINANKNLPAQNQFSFGAQFNYNFGGR